jgi:eukaryotic-like serine/threonine-protein kinase
VAQHGYQQDGYEPYPPPPPPPDSKSDTIDRMLRPQGLFQQQRPYGTPGAFGPQGQYAPQDPYGQGQYGQGSYGPGQYAPQGQYPAPPQGQYGPPPWPAPPGSMPTQQQGMPGMSDTMPRGLPPAPGGGPMGMPGGGGRMRLPGGGRRLIPVLIAGAMAVVVVVGVVVVLQSLRGNTSSPPTTAPTSTAKSSSSAAPASNQAEKQAATQLAGLLSQSGNDRGDVINAVDDVQNCGKSLARDEQVLGKAASNRRALLTRLGNLPGRSTLPAAMLSSLTGAWQASAQDDSDLSKWAGDEIAGCRKKTVNNDPNYKASLGPDSTATTDKMAFTGQWNPIAKRYGLPTYQWEQL